MLDRVLPLVVEAEGQLAANVIVGGMGHHDPAGLGEAFQPHGDVDAVAGDVAVLDLDIAEMDADPELQPALLGQVAVEPGHRLLHRHGTADRFHQAGELDEELVSGRLGDAAAVAVDRRLNHLLQHRLDAVERAALVPFHQAAVPDHIGDEDCSEAALDAFLGHIVQSALERTQRPGL